MVIKVYTQPLSMRRIDVISLIHTYDCHKPLDVVSIYLRFTSPISFFKLLSASTTGDNKHAIFPIHFQFHDSILYLR